MHLHSASGTISTPRYQLVDCDHESTQRSKNRLSNLPYLIARIVFSKLITKGNVISNVELTSIEVGEDSLFYT